MIDYNAIAENIYNDKKTETLDEALDIVVKSANFLYIYIKGADNKYTYAMFEKDGEQYQWLIQAMAENAIRKSETSEYKSYSENNLSIVFNNPSSYYVEEMRYVQRRAGVV